LVSDAIGTTGDEDGLGRISHVAFTCSGRKILNHRGHREHRGK
jgi:hypothetical protein